MTEPEKAWWAAAEQARDLLAARILMHPDVSMIDIGVDPRQESERPVLRVHLRAGAPVQNLPEQVNGIPVRVVYADYKLQGEPRSSGETQGGS